MFSKKYILSPRKYLKYVLVNISAIQTLGMRLVTT
jgi:hypothetical protein